MLGKYRRKKVRKTFFYIHTNIFTKKWGGGKRAKQFFQKHKNSASKKWCKKIDGKSAKNVFLYSHQYRDQKIGGTKRAKHFFQKHTISASKKCLEKNLRKIVRKKFFYIHTNIVTKKLGGNNSRNNFSRIKRIVRAINVGKISSEKSDKNVFLYSHK